jgi:lactate racemase
VNVPSDAPEHFVGCGEVAFDLASRCFPPVAAFVNASVLAADVRVGVGMITPHLDAGFSGGAKIVLPGVCSLATVDAFHRASAFVEENQLGNADAPLRRMLETFVQAHAPLQFILNVVLHPDGMLHSCVAGDPVLAHRVGADQAREVYGVRLPQCYPVVVANAAPYDQDLWQSIKGAWAGDLAIADGGTLILVAAAPEGNSLYPLVPRYAGRDPDALQAEILEGAVEDAMQAATGVMWARLRRRVRLVLVSPGLGPETAAAMGIGYAENVQQAVDEAVLALLHTQRAGCVAVLPQAGVVLPVVHAWRGALDQ